MKTVKRVMVVLVGSILRVAAAILLALAGALFVAIIVPVLVIADSARRVQYAIWPQDREIDVEKAVNNIKKIVAELSKTNINE